MTKNEAIQLVNESLIDQDTKFTREINALFKQKETVELLQQAYDMSDDNAKMSLMDATEKQFLDKFAKDGGSGDDSDSSDESSDTTSDFEEDGSNIDFEEDGSDIDTETDGSDSTDTVPTDTEDGGDADPFGGDDSNPFADFGGDGGESNDAAPAEPSNPFESVKFRNGKFLNESQKRVHTGFRRKKK